MEDEKKVVKLADEQVEQVAGGIEEKKEEKKEERDIPTTKEREKEEKDPNANHNTPR